MVLLWDEEAPSCFKAQVISLLDSAGPEWPSSLAPCVWVSSILQSPVCTYLPLRLAWPTETRIDLTFLWNSIRLTCYFIDLYLVDFHYFCLYHPIMYHMLLRGKSHSWFMSQFQCCVVIKGIYFCIKKTDSGSVLTPFFASCVMLAKYWASLDLGVHILKYKQ